MANDDLSQRLARCQRMLASSQEGFWESNLRTQEIGDSLAFLAMFGLAEGDLSSRRGAATERRLPR